MCTKQPKEPFQRFINKAYINALKDSKLNLLACGYVDLFSIHNHWNYDRVSIPYWCLYWNRKPGALIKLGQRQIALKSSSIVLIAPHTVFSTYNQGHGNQLFIHFQIITPHINLKPQAYVIPVISYLKTLLQKIILVLRHNEPASWQFSLLSRALVELALSHIVDRNLHLPVIDPHIQKAITHLETHFKSNVSNATLAHQSGISLSAFMRLFKSQIGHSPHNYLMLKRIEKACIMLHYSETSIKQIAEDTGFCDRYHFSRIFRRCQGISPAEFRRNNFNPFK